MRKIQETEIVIQGLTSDFLKTNYKNQTNHNDRNSKSQTQIRIMQREHFNLPKLFWSLEIGI